MKKLISLLSASVLVLSTSVLMVSCVPVQKENPLNIGKNITKVENAVEYKNGTNNTSKKSEFTNYFIVGDSLSDVDGMSDMLRDKTKVIIKDTDVDINLPKIPGVPLNINLKTNLTVKANINLTLGTDGTDGYGFKEGNKWRSAFMNAKPAGYLLNERLGFKSMESSSAFADKLDKDMRNYSVGGATASDVLDKTTGLLLNDVTVDKQAKALISQHHVEKTNNDLVFFEIGGNDMFTLAGIDINDTKLQDKVIKQSMERIRITLFTLLNNGIEKVIIGTPPDITKLPRYNGIKDETVIKHLVDLSSRFHTEMINTINSVKEFYPTQIETYDIYDEFDGLKDRHRENYLFEKTGSKDEDPSIITNRDDGFTNKTNIKIEPIKIYASYINNATGATIEDVLFATINIAEDFSINFKLEAGIIEAAKIIASKKLTLRIDADINVTVEREGDTETDIDSYFFTDFVHPTRIVHELVADDIEGLARKLEK